MVTVVPAPILPAAGAEALTACGVGIALSELVLMLCGCGATGAAEFACALDCTAGGARAGADEPSTLIETVPGAFGFPAAAVFPALAPVVMVTVADGTFDESKLCTRVLFPPATMGDGGGGGALSFALPVGASSKVIVDLRIETGPEATIP
jgi:hypothetical protein